MSTELLSILGGSRLYSFLVVSLSLVFSRLAISKSRSSSYLSESANGFGWLGLLECMRLTLSRDPRKSTLFVGYLGYGLKLEEGTLDF